MLYEGVPWGKAMQVVRAVRAKWKPYVTKSSRPMLERGWPDGPDWVVTWEDGPKEWAMWPLEERCVDIEATVLAQAQQQGGKKVKTRPAVPLPSGVSLKPVKPGQLGVWKQRRVERNGNAE